MAEQPLETLSAQLATAFLKVLYELQQKVNAGFAAGEITAEARDEMTAMIVEAMALPLSVGVSAKAHNAKAVRSSEARRAGGRERAANAKRHVQERDLELLAAARELRKAHPERSINSLARRLAARFSCSESTIKRRLAALKFSPPEKSDSTS